MAAEEMPTDPEEAAIVCVVLDYFEGWYDGDVERMRRALHPYRTTPPNARGKRLVPNRTAKAAGPREPPPTTARSAG